MKRVVEIGGWIGVICIVGAYAAANFDILSIKGFAYLGLNIVGSCLVGVDAYMQKNYQPVVLQVAWILIAVSALVRLAIL